VTTKILQVPQFQCKEQKALRLSADQQQIDSFTVRIFFYAMVHPFSDICKKNQFHMYNSYAQYSTTMRYAQKKIVA